MKSKNHLFLLLKKNDPSEIVKPTIQFKKKGNKIYPTGVVGKLLKSGIFKLEISENIFKLFCKI